MFFENFEESVFLFKVIVVANQQLTNINSEIINNNLASNIFAAGSLGFLFLSSVFVTFICRSSQKKEQTCTFSVHRMDIISGFNSDSGFMLVEIVVT